MNDIFHEWGSDLAIGSGGDLATSAGPDAVRQRVIRRLLTNAGDYIWNLDYGGGLGQFVGTPANPAGIEAIVRTQLALDVAIPTSPAPQVNVRVADAANGSIVASVIYFDSSSTTPIQFNVSTG